MVEFPAGSRNWLLHARYVRGEHSLCMELAEELQRSSDGTHRYAHFVKGSVLADAGRYQEALERFHSCIRLQPQDPEPLKQVGKCLFRQGRYQLSLEAYLEADKLTKHPDPEIYCALAECAWNLGSAERGVEWARAGAAAGGGERAGALLARLLLAAGDPDGALAAYDQAIETQACGADTLAAAGALRLRRGQAREAFQLLGLALSLRPAHHAAALALAAMLLRHRDLDAALARLKAALTAHPTCVASHSNLGLALLAKKKYVAALTCLQRAAWAAPLSARAAHNLGLALLLCRRPASAFRRLAAAAALRPANAYTMLLIAVSLERLHDSRADAAYQRAVELAPDDPLLRLNLAAAHARAGRLAAAASDAAACRPDHDLQLASSLASLLELLREAGADLNPLPAPAIEPAPAVEDLTADDENAPIQRTANLIVLPPLILGYDELYEDDDDDDNEPEPPSTTQRPSEKPTTKASTTEVTTVAANTTEITTQSTTNKELTTESTTTTELTTESTTSTELTTESTTTTELTTESTATIETTDSAELNPPEATSNENIPAARTYPQKQDKKRMRPQWVRGERARIRSPYEITNEIYTKRYSKYSNHNAYILS